MLPLQGASYSQPYSLERDTQLRTVLETMLAGILGNGLVSGGALSQVAPYTAQLATGTTVLCRGVLYTTVAAQNVDCTGGNGDTLYLWGTLVRTAASQAAVVNLDTWALTLSAVANDPTPPNAAAALLGTALLDGSGIASLAAPVERTFSGSSSVVTLAPFETTLAALSTSYLVTADFSAVGEFADLGYEAVLQSDEAGVMIQPEYNARRRGVAAWTVYVGAAAVYGAYGYARDLRLSATLKGDGWSGSSLVRLAATWAVTPVG